MKLTNGCYNGKGGEQTIYRFLNEETDKKVDMNFESALMVFETMADDLGLTEWEEIAEKLYELHNKRSSLSIAW